MDILKFDKQTFDQMVSNLESAVGEIPSTSIENVYDGTSVSESIDVLADVYSKMNVSLSDYVSSLENMILSLKHVEKTMFIVDDLMSDIMNV